MSGRASSRRPWPAAGRGRPGAPGERGVSWVSVLLLLVVVGGGYLAWVWLPLWFDHYTVKQVVADYGNQAVKNKDDAQLIHDMVAKIHSLAQVDGVDAEGRRVKLPAIPLEEQAVTWQRDDATRSLHVAFEYERPVVYPLLDRTDLAVFALDKTYDLNLANWGPAR